MDVVVLPDVLPGLAPLADAELGPLRLRDGRSVRLEPMRAADAPAEQAFVAGLSAASRYRRFHVGIRELPESLLRGLTEVDQDQHVAIVARSGDGAGAIVADARYVRSDDPHEAEFAIAVADDWQHLGLGRALLQRLMRHARAHGVERVVGDVLWDNRPMIAMVKRLGGRFVRQPGSVHRALFELD